MMIRVSLAFAAVVGCSSHAHEPAGVVDAPVVGDAPADATTAVHCAPLPSAPSGTIAAAHPRIEIAGASDLAALRAKVATDATAATWYATQIAQAKSDLMTEQHKPLLDQAHYNDASDPTSYSRGVMQVITNYAGVYLLNPSDASLAGYEQQAIADAMLVSSYPDWYHGRAVLATAEMAFGVAIVYDWLYDQLTDAQRATLAGALYANAIVPINGDYDCGNTPGCKSVPSQFLRFGGNQSEVDNGGALVAALAIGGPDDPDAADRASAIAETIAQAPKWVQAGLAQYASDGGWHEGPNYWDYGTHYLAHMIASGESALGTDFGLPAATGLAQTGTYRIHATGATGETFNFADVGSVVAIGSQPSFWLARQFDDPREELDGIERANHPAGSQYLVSTAPHGPYETYENLDVFDIIRYEPGCANADVDPLPLDAMFRGVEVATMRTSWTDPNAIYVGFKAGDNTQTHVHYDPGNFVFDMAGQRWAVDLGDDAYSLPGYFEKTGRPLYYRTRTEGHNTLSISTTYPQPVMSFANQDISATAMKIIAFQGGSANTDLAYAVADLTAAYTKAATGVPGGLTSALRGVAIEGGNQVVIDDELTSPAAAEVAWTLHTRATPTVGADGTTVSLVQNGTTIELRLVDAPAGTTFAVAPADPNPVHHLGEKTNGWTENKDGTLTCQPGPCVYEIYLRVMLPPAMSTRIAVRFASDSNTPLPQLVPLAQWIAASLVQR
ncbi:MAG TPA: heparinase II/III family protein [Kofleriaceae bacterium]|nr:heparinase II/III family protein [Kofleriaceae bacterium]